MPETEQSTKIEYQEYRFSEPEREIVTGLLVEIQTAQSRLGTVLTLIHRQQGLVGNYGISADGTALIPKEASNGR